MPQQLSQKIRTTLSKGLLTEYSELNFPEDASVDELNCELRQAGNRTRRLGIKQIGDETIEEYGGADIVTTHTWEAVNNKVDVNFLVIQLGATLRFYDKSVFPLADGAVPIGTVDSDPYIIDLTDFDSSDGEGAANSRVQCVSFKGKLVVVGPDIDAFYITREDDETFSTTEINFKVRDFEWFSDPDTRFEPILFDDTTAGRIYDLRNSGWVDDLGTDALDAYRTASTDKNPPLTHPWYSGKNATGDFDYAEYNKIYTGNTLTANGHFIIPLFPGARDTRVVDTSYVGDGSGVGFTTVVLNPDDTLPEAITRRFSCAAVYAGRVFFSGVDGRVYFSRILDNIKDIGDLYQVNDPTSEDFSDLLATDGGWVEIGEASNIHRLHVYGSSLFAFAANGVWRLSGVDDVFRATEFSVTKITDYGLTYQDSFISGMNNVPFWWSFLGIHTIVVDDNGYFREVNISRTTIQTYFDNITVSQKASVKGAFDGFRNKVVWFYGVDQSIIPARLNYALFFDVDLQAFYPWQISNKTTANPYVVGAYFSEAKTTSVYASSDLDMLCFTSTGALFFARFSGTTFLDWESANYSSYLESAYNFLGDLARQKTSPYITILMKVTETGFVLDGATYDLVRNSSLGVSAYWDFKRTPSQQVQEAYRFKRPIVVDISELDTFDYPNTVLSSRLKLRGRGRSVRLRFESTEGKDFNLLGWETLDGVNPSY